jgi:hypothetical protein
VRAVRHKVVASDMVWPLGPQPDAGTIAQPQPAALGHFVRQFQSLLAPDALDALVVYAPTLTMQQTGHLAVAVTAILQRQLHDPLRERFLVLGAVGLVALRRTRLAQQPADSSL